MVYVIWKTPKLRCTTNILLAWLTISDVSIDRNYVVHRCVPVLDFRYIPRSLSFLETHRGIERVGQVCPTPHSGIAMMITIAIDRYVAMVHPFSYSLVITEKWAKTSICLCWMYGLLTGISGSVYLFKIDFSTCSAPYSLVMQTVLDSGILTISSIVMIILYGRICLVAKRHNSQINVMTSNSLSETDTGSNQRVKYQKQLKITRSTAVIIGSFVILYFPMNLGRFLQGIGDTSPYTQNLIDVGIATGMFNEALNWLIYGLSSRQFRLAGGKILKSL